MDLAYEGSKKENEVALPCFTYRDSGEKFYIIQDIEECMDDEGEIELFKSLTPLKFLIRRNKRISIFYSELRASFRPVQEDESLDDYNRVVMTTVHKAKGLEFNEALINDDFRFRLL